jgi:hypothetical protein
LIGDPNGYVFSAAAKAISLQTGTFVINKDVNTILTLKADLSPKAQLTTSASSTYLGIGDSTGDNSEWAGAGSYTMTAKGAASGVAITGVNDGTNVYGSNAFTMHKGILVISKNSSSPSGTMTAGAGKEVLRLDLAAVGDDITVNEMEFCVAGTATGVTGTGSVTLKSSDEAVTYATLTRTVHDTYWDAVLSTATDYYPMDAGVTGGSCFSFGDAAGTSAHNDSVAFSTTLQISSGETKTVKLFGDTTGATTNNTLQVTVGPNSSASYNATTSGVECEDSSGTDIDLATTKNLPVNGGSLVY